jgi:hypothetical protein
VAKARAVVEAAEERARAGLHHARHRGRLREGPLHWPLQVTPRLLTLPPSPPLCFRVFCHWSSSAFSNPCLSLHFPRAFPFVFPAFSFCFLAPRPSVPHAGWMPVGGPLGLTQWRNGVHMGTLWGSHGGVWVHMGGQRYHRGAHMGAKWGSCGEHGGPHNRCGVHMRGHGDYRRGSHWGTWDHCGAHMGSKWGSHGGVRSVRRSTAWRPPMQATSHGPTWGHMGW